MFQCSYVEVIYILYSCLILIKHYLWIKEDVFFAKFTGTEIMVQIFNPMRRFGQFVLIPSHAC